MKALGAFVIIEARVKVALAFLFLAGPPFFLVPVVDRALRSVSPAIMLASGCAVMGAGSLLCLRLDVRDPSLVNFILPDVLTGIGFALSVASLTAAAINTLPLQLAGRASATTSMPRDFGFALGPIIAGAVALSSAGNTMLAGLGPIAARLPANQAGRLLGLAHGSGCHLAWLVSGIACLAAAVIAAAGLDGVRHAVEPAAESLADPLHSESGALRGSLPRESVRLPRRRR